MSRTRQSVQRQLELLYTNLDVIEEKIAIYTELEAPVHLITERERTTESIAELKALLETGGLPDEVAAPVMGNAPPLPPRYVPRKEVSSLRDLLLSPENRSAAIAVQGMGGVGKTTLAIALCHDEQVIEAFPHGILWATLGPQADVLSWQATWGKALDDDLTGLPDAKARAARLRSLLQHKRCLLVIDDVWDAAHLPLMQVGGPQCVTLVTTRERKVAQKVSLARDLGVLEPEQAIALLEQWAGEMAEGEKAVAGELARRLGYLPLALALAGAQAQDGETWDDLLAAFRDVQEADVTVLDLDDPTMRDESLKLAFDLSVERLGDAMPEQFAMLGVFAAGREAPFAAEAAAAVWDVEPTPAKKTLGRLARAALLDREDDSYSLHLLLGDYARSRLDQATRQSAEAGHRAYYLGVAQRSEQEWQAAEAALPQMRAAWGRVPRDDADGLCAWAIATHRFFRMRGRRDDERATLEVLEASSATSQAPLPDVAYLWAEYYEAVGDYAQAQAAAERALAAARGRADVAGEGACLAQLGLIARRQGDYDEAQDWYNRALELLQGEEAHPDGKAQVLNGLGTVHRQQGRLEEARACYEQALALSRESGNRRHEAQALNYLGAVAYRQRNFAEAVAYHRQALEIRRAIGDRAGEGVSLFDLALATRDMGDYGQAQGYFSEALDIQQTTRNRWEEINVWNSLGGMYQQLGDLPKAQACLQRGLILAEEIGDEEGQAYLLSNLGLVVRDQGDLETAEKLLSDGLAIMQALDNKHQISFFLSYLSTVSLQAGDYQQAIERAQEALSLRQELDLRLRMADDLATLAAAYLAAGNVAQALVYAGQALAILDGCGGQGPEFPQRDYFTCYQVLAAAGQEERAQAALQSAYNLVMARAEKTTDPALRQSFMERVPVNCKIVQEYGKRET